MKLSSVQMRKLYREERLVLSFIGMSNIGKSHWSERLEELGFVRICIDELIESLLETELQRFGCAGLADMAKWLGQPGDSQYLAREQRYLALEAEVIELVCKKVRTLKARNVVIDTTGSVVYLPTSSLAKLKEASTIIHLRADSTIVDTLVERFAEHPKPLIWHDVGRRAAHTFAQRVAGLYKDLLHDRLGKYRDLADHEYHASALHLHTDPAAFFYSLASSLS